MPRPHIETPHESEVFCRMKARQTILYQPTLLLPADAADGNNVQNLNDNAVPAAPPVAQEVSVFLVPVFVFFPRYSGWALFS